MGPAGEPIIEPSQVLPPSPQLKPASLQPSPAPVFRCSIADRWRALTECFKYSVAIETEHLFSLCHGYHSASRRFVGIQVPLKDLGSNSALSMLRCLAMSSKALYIRESRSTTSGEAGFYFHLFQRSSEKGYFHSSKSMFRRSLNEDRLLRSFGMAGVSSFIVNRLIKSRRQRQEAERDLSEQPRDIDMSTRKVAVRAKTAISTEGASMPQLGQEGSRRVSRDA
jgi:hypothetical protein